METKHRGEKKKWEGKDREETKLEKWDKKRSTRAQERKKHKI